MAAKRKVTKTGQQKDLELKQRPPPLRGEDAAPRIQARHNSAEAQHALHIEAKTFVAKEATVKAERAKATRDARLRDKREKVESSSAAAAVRHESAVAERRHKGAQEVSKVMTAVQQRSDEEFAAAKERKQRADQSAQAAAERRQGEIERVRGKGADEVSKVMTIVRQRSDKELATTAAAARAQDEQMAAAAERHAFEIARVQNKARDEVQKVGRAAATAKVTATAKAEALAATSAALQEAAAERRAAKVGAIAAKGAAESAKVEAMGVRPYFQARSKPLSVGDGSPAEQQPLSPDSVVPSTPETIGAGGRHRYLAPSPPTPPPIPRAGDGSEGIARGADLMLTLMRGGAPNNEVLLASTLEDFMAIASKYKISLQSGAGGGTTSVATS